MIIIEVSGGLGNQMFQYAFARALALKNNDVLFITDRLLKNDALRKYSLNHYSLSNYIKKVEQSPVIFASHRLRYNLGKVLSALNINTAKIGIYDYLKQRTFETPVYRENRMNIYRGLFQSSILFDSYKEEIIKDFTLLDKLDCDELKIIEQIESTQSVCVHIRRGDYLNSPEHYVCNEKYYRQAMEVISSKLQKCHFYMFSDDTDWVKRHFSGSNITVVDVGKTEFSDMEIMSHCKHFIISNSTFSWWAQYLSNNKNDKIVIAPSKWMNTQKPKEHSIYQKDWILIEV